MCLAPPFVPSVRAMWTERFTLTAIGRKLGIAPSSVHRLLEEGEGAP